MARYGSKPIKGNVDAVLTGPVTAFGEIEVAELTPVVQCQFPYNINTDIIESRKNQSGDVTQATSMAVITSGASANSAAHMLSRTPVRYNPGVGVDIRFTALFTTGVSGNTQLAGIGEVGDGLFFGYNEAVFSILRRELGVPEVQTLTIDTAAVTASGDVTVTLDGDDVVVAIAQNDTVREIAVKVAAADFSDAGTGWSVFLDNNTVIFKSWSGGDKSSTFAYVDTDTTGSAGSFAETIAGVATTNNWIAQTAWNRDKMDGKGPSGMILDPTKMNVYKIQFQYLGAGAIDYRIEEPKSGALVLVHRIEYANNNTVPSLINPTLPLHMMSKNVANTSAIVVKTGSMAGLIEGKESDVGLIKGATNLKLSVGTSQVSIVAIRNKVVYQGKLNRVKVRIDGFNVSSDGTKVVITKLVKDPILNGTPAFADVSTNTSVIEVDTAGTTYTGGTEILDVVLGRTDSKEIPLKDFKIDLLPGEMILVSGASSGASTSDIGASVHWRELF